MNELVEMTEKFDAIKKFQNLVKTQLIDGEDYGKIASISKPFLFKSGAEKILSILGVKYEDIQITETWEKRLVGDVDVQYYEVQVKLIGILNGEVIGYGIGSCNTLEKKNCYENGKFITDDIHYYSKKNTILKMAKKRAIVDLALMVGSLSNVFVQDEDVVDIEEKREERKEEIKPPTQKQLDYLKRLLNEHPAEIEKIVEMIKGKIDENGELEIEGNSLDVSKAIDYLLNLQKKEIKKENKNDKN